MPVYYDTKVETDKGRVGETNPEKQVLVGACSEPIPLDQFKQQNPCRTKWWNTSNQCEDLK